MITKEDIAGAWAMAYECAYPEDLLSHAIEYFNKHQYAHACIILVSKQHKEIGKLELEDIWRFKAGLHPKVPLVVGSIFH